MNINQKLLDWIKNLEAKNAKRKKLFLGVLAAAILLSCSACGSTQRWVKDQQSEFGNGLNCVINVYSLDGKTKIATYEGKIDVETTDTNNKVKFDFDGKRYIYVNATVEIIEK